MNQQYITDNQGNKIAVILPVKEYNKMVEDLEELEDIKLYDEAKSGKQEFTDAKEAFRQIEENRKNEDV